ncbi:hypothetical protein [Rhodococcoides fascians]|uniref:hypothetical protein n=1 Tax=Rhodococcoides fascians TaxID=1828 RepID=UPI00050CA85E|nr:hypothetical protein [Rhodococcus fascians]
MTYRIPTPEQQAKIHAAGLPIDRELRYYIDNSPRPANALPGPDYDLEWTRAQFDLMGWSYFSASGPEYSETRIAEEETGDIDDLATRLDELLHDPDNTERAEDTLIEVTITETALDEYLAERTTTQEVLAA